MTNDVYPKVIILACVVCGSEGYLLSGDQSRWCACVYMARSMCLKMPLQIAICCWVASSHDNVVTLFYFGGKVTGLPTLLVFSSIIILEL